MSDKQKPNRSPDHRSANRHHNNRDYIRYSHSPPRYHSRYSRSPSSYRAAPFNRQVHSSDEHVVKKPQSQSVRNSSLSTKLEPEFIKSDPIKNQPFNRQEHSSDERVVKKPQSQSVKNSSLSTKQEPEFIKSDPVKNQPFNRQEHSSDEHVVNKPQSQSVRNSSLSTKQEPEFIKSDPIKNQAGSIIKSSPKLMTSEPKPTVSSPSPIITPSINSNIIIKNKFIGVVIPSPKLASSSIITQDIPKKKSSKVLSPPPKDDLFGSDKDTLSSTSNLSDPDSSSSDDEQRHRKPGRPSKSQIELDKHRETITIPGRARPILVSSINQPDRSGRTLLFKYVELNAVPTVELLLKNGADVNFPDHLGFTPLHVASLKGHLSLVKLLIQHDADVHASGGDGDTPLHDAVQNGHVDVVEFLLKVGANPLWMNQHENTAVDVVEDEGIRKVLEVWMKKSEECMKRDEQGRTGLHNVCTTGQIEHVQEYINFGVDLNIPDFAGWSCLHEAVANQHTEIVELLCTYGADVNSRAGNGETPLFDAVRTGNVRVIRVLMEFGGDVHVVDNAGKSVFELSGANEVGEVLKGEYTRRRSMYTFKNLIRTHQQSTTDSSSSDRSHELEKRIESAGKFLPRRDSEASIEPTIVGGEVKSLVNGWWGGLDPDASNRQFASAREERKFNALLKTLPGGSEGKKRKKDEWDGVEGLPLRKKEEKKKAVKKEMTKPVADKNGQGKRKIMDEKEEKREPKKQKPEPPTKKPPIPISSPPKPLSPPPLLKKKRKAFPGLFGTSTGYVNANEIKDELKPTTTRPPPAKKIKSDEQEPSITSLQKDQGLKYLRCMPLYSITLPGTDRKEKYMVDYQLGLFLGMKTGRSFLEKYPTLKSRVATLSEKILLETSPLSESLYKCRSALNGGTLSKWCKCIETANGYGLKLDNLDIQFLNEKEVMKVVRTAWRKEQSGHTVPLHGDGVDFGKKFGVMGDEGLEVLVERLDLFENDGEKEERGFVTGLEDGYVHKLKRHLK